MENFSLADVASVVRKDDDFGGASWIILLFIFLLGIGGNGLFGNNRAGNYATQEDVASGFSTSSILSNQRDLSTGLFGLQNGMNQGFSGLNTAILTTGCNIERAIDQCCCKTNSNIDSLRYDNAKNTCDIINAGNMNTQRILDFLCQQNTQALRDKLCEMSQSAQTAEIIAALKTTTTTA